jgi:hypothetical protein
VPPELFHSSYGGSPYGTQPAAAQPNRQTRRALARRPDQIQERGALQALEVQAAAFVGGTRITAGVSLANMAMPMLGALSNLEDQLNEVAPTGGQRYRAIADAVTVLAIEEIISLRQGG